VRGIGGVIEQSLAGEGEGEGEEEFGSVEQRCCRVGTDGSSHDEE